jgi:hypothetical protein
MKKIHLILLAFVLLASACTEKKKTKEDTKPLNSIAADAFIYGRPLIESYDNIYKYAIDSTNSQYAPLNRLYIIRKPSTPQDTWVVTPNVDTPYMRAWMDLTKDAVVIVVPKIEDKRYWVIQLMDVYSNNFSFLGSRTEQWDGGKYLITGPNWKGEIPEGFKQVKSTTNYCAALARILLLNSDDVPTLNKIQDGFQLMTLNEYNGKEAIPTDTEWLKAVDLKNNPLENFAIINEMIQRNAPAEEEKADVAAFDALGFGADFDLAKLSEETKTALTEGLKKGQQTILDKMSPEKGDATFHNGWLIPKENLGNFGTDYLNRAATTVQGYMANSPEEAVYYYGAVDSQMKPLTGANKYVLHFEKNQIPEVQFFWSMTMYDGESKLLIENELNRYAIGNRTEGLIYNEDGSLDVYVQAEEPEGDKAKNWLPSPKGTFYTILRLYGPSDAIIHGTYDVPGLTIYE